jgi:hypothetical protein
MAMVVALTGAMPAMAQVTAAKDDDILDAPPQFKESLSNGRIKPAATELTRQNIQGAPIKGPA